MTTILMCKDMPVINIDTKEVYNRNLLPGAVSRGMYVRDWLKLRYSSNTNTLARNMIGLTFGHVRRSTVDANTRALSLSDCYWIKDESDPTVFAEVSPYFSPFWDGLKEYVEGQSAPTLYVGGYMNKRWINRFWLYKSGEAAVKEQECSEFCRQLGVKCAEVVAIGHGAYVKNLTTPEVMLEQYDMSGMVDPDGFTVEDVIRDFGWEGLEMVLIDALLGNGDRHAANIAFLRDANTGAYLGRSPLYDFDHAYDTTRKADALTSEAAEAATGMRDQAIQLLEAAIPIAPKPWVADRAQTILKKLA